MTIRRRQFLALVGAAGAAAFPRIVFAQQPAKVPRIALARGGGGAVTDMTATGDPSWAAFIQELAKRGFVEGRTVVFERYTVSASNAEDIAHVIVASAPDIVFWGGSTNAAVAALPLTRTIPMVAITGDLLGQGLVTNLAHPGGNLTGVATTASPESEGKNLALLAEAVPRAKRFAYLQSGSGGQVRATAQSSFQAVIDAASQLGLVPVPVIFDNAGGDAELARAFDAILASKVEMVQFGRDSAVQIGSPLLAKLALAARMPAISPFVAFAEAGGLMSYGVNLYEVYRQAASYVALILNGAEPGNLPVLQPTIFDFAINQKTANAIGISIPASLLIQATQVIQ